MLIVLLIFIPVFFLMSLLNILEVTFHFKNSERLKLQVRKKPENNHTITHVHSDNVRGATLTRHYAFILLIRVCVSFVSHCVLMVTAPTHFSG